MKLLFSCYISLCSYDGTVASIDPEKDGIDEEVVIESSQLMSSYSNGDVELNTLISRTSKSINSSLEDTNTSATMYVNRILRQKKEIPALLLLLL
ncbi:hypothetical protein [Cellulophaga baltica]|uniref:hypothetical protein n=1 Tax=Cellulophaga baltica TaxID=76594 RepID=UPI0024944E2F|nr:hypothetical protein [Cellulophaga baltica]